MIFLESKTKLKNLMLGIISIINNQKNNKKQVIYSLLMKMMKIIQFQTNSKDQVTISKTIKQRMQVQKIMMNLVSLMIPLHLLLTTILKISCHQHKLKIKPLERTVIFSILNFILKKLTIYQIKTQLREREEK